MSNEPKQAAYVRRRREAAQKGEASANKDQSNRIIAALNALSQQVGRERRESRWHIAEVLGLWAAAAVGLLAIHASSQDADKQRAVMQGQLTAMQGQINEMHAEQRPNLWVTSDLGAPKLTANGADPDHTQVVWTVHLTNYGKSFVAGGTWQTYMRFGNSDFVRSQGQPGDVEIGPVAPGQVITTSVVSRVLTRPDTGSFTDVIGDLQVKILIDYRDIPGGEYKSIICLTVISAKSIGFCPGGSIE